MNLLNIYHSLCCLLLHYCSTSRKITGSSLDSTLCLVLTRRRRRTRSPGLSHCLRFRFVRFRVLCESLHLQTLGHTQHRHQLILLHLYLPPVHVLQQQLQVLRADVLQEDDVLFWPKLADGEIWGANPDFSDWSPTVSDGFRRFPKVSKGSRWFPRVSKGFQQSLNIYDGYRWLPMVSEGFQRFPTSS